MKTWLRSVAIILCFTLLSGIAVFATENSVTISVSNGNVENLKNIDIIINPAEEGVLVTFTVKDAFESLIVVEEKETDQKGEIHYSYIHNAGDGTYTVTAKRMDTNESATKVFEMDKALEDKIVADIKTAVESKNYESVKTLLLSAVNTLNLNVSLYGDNVPMDKIAKIFTDTADTSKMSELRDIEDPFYKAMTVELFSSNDKKVSDILAQKEISAVLEFDNCIPKVKGENVYSIADVKVQEEINKSVVGESYKNIDEIKNSFVLQSLLKSLSYGKWNLIYDILKAYQSENYINISFAEFESLSKNKQNVLLQKIGNKDYKDYNDVTVSINKLIDDAGNKSPGGGSGGSSGGGFSGGGFSGSGVTVPKDNDKNKPQPEAKPATDKKSVFTDMEDTKWAIEAVEYLNKTGIVSGRGNDKFEPKGAVTRAEFVKMIVELVKVPDTDLQLPFSDVSESDWSYEYIKRGYNAGIISGRTDTFFDKDSTVTREEAAVILYRTIMKFEKNPPSVGLNVFVNFDDIDTASDWAKDDIVYLLRIGLIRGKVLSNYMPKDLMNRAEAASMIYSYLKIVKGVNN